MKSINKFLIIGLLLATISCGESLELDELLVNPNSPTADAADLPSLYSSVQIEFENFVSAPQFFTMQMSRQRAMTAGNDYATAFSPTDFDNTWRQAYSDFLPDADAVIASASLTNQLFEVGTAKIMKSYVLTTLIDLFGAVPYDEAGQGISVISPTSQSGTEVYAIAGTLLEEGITALTDNTAAAPNDLIYGQSSDKWIAAAKSLQLRIAVTTGNDAAFDALVTEGGYITSSSDNFVLQYGSNRANPDSRHPFYVDSYEANDGQYQSNWLMYTMLNDKTEADPRLRSYFYRQVAEVPVDNINIFDCIHSVLPDPASAPAHYVACAPQPYCVADLDAGFYGRDHMNGNGIPPDGAVRTIYGVYPGGGKFDANTFENTQQAGIQGGLGAGIHPIFTKAMVDFYIAEMYAKRGSTADAKTALLSGVRASLETVRAFSLATDVSSMEEFLGVNPIDGSDVFGSDFLPSDAAIDMYVDEVEGIFDASTDILDVIALEAMIASYGNGLEGFNLIRRTGRPLSIQPAILNTAGTMLRSAFLPAVHVNLNQNVSQKSIYDQVFWDNATLSACFN